VKISDRHIPVLLEQVLESIQSPNAKLKIVVDGTLGAGGHARHILHQYPDIQRYIGIDKDPEALEIASETLRDFRNVVEPTPGDFRRIPDILEKAGVGAGKVDAFLLDLGVSSMQLDDAEKGFSFIREGPLDMRMDPTQPLTAAAIINGWPEDDIGRIIRDYGEDKRWKRLARAICQAREMEEIRTTVQLARIISENSPREWKKRRSIHPATLTFQALRVEVNSELDAVTTVIPKLLPYLSHSGRILIISFHSLEDRIVKRAFLAAQNDLSADPLLEVVTKRPLVANEDEIQANSRSRSAKLRVLQKLRPGEELSLGKKKNKYAHLKGKTRARRSSSPNPDPDPSTPTTNLSNPGNPTSD